MTQTFRQFIEECENWEYSKEYFEVMKEYSELQLAQQYYESICFAEENPGLLMEGQIIEMEYDGKTNTASAIGEKSKKTKKTLLQRLIKILGPFGKFIDRLIRQHAKNKIDKKLYEGLTNKRYNNDEIELINQKFEEYRTLGNICIILGSHKKYKTSTGLSMNPANDMAKAIEATWASKLMIGHIDRYSHVKEFPYDFKALTEILRRFRFLGKTSTKEEINGVLSQNTKSFELLPNLNLDDHMFVDTDIKSYDKISKLLNETIAILQEKVGNLEDNDSVRLVPADIATFGKVIANAMKAIQLATSYQTKMGKFLIDTFIDKKEA